MIIYIVIPVFNRLDETKNIIRDLREQITNKEFEIFIINDGSSDGTSEWLENQKDINVLNGNGSLYWAGAVNKAINHILNKGINIDVWILLLNNDVTIEKNYIESLVNIGVKFYPTAVGSVIKNKYTKKLISIGPKVLPWRLIVDDLITKDFIDNKQEVITDVDALSGRGVLFPIKSIIDSKGFRPLVLPHYFADYELSIRVKNKGYKLVTSLNSIVYSSEDFDQVIKNRKKEKLLQKLFSRKSSYLIYAKFFFWWQASNKIQKISLPLRIFLFIIKPGLRKNL